MKNLLPAVCILGFALNSSAEEVLFFDDFIRGETSAPSDLWEIYSGPYGRGQFGAPGWVSKLDELWIAMSRFSEQYRGKKFAQTCLYSKESFSPGLDGTLELIFKANIDNDLFKGIVYTVGFANKPDAETGRNFVRLEIPSNLTANSFKDQIRFTYASDWDSSSGLREVLKSPTAGTHKSIERDLGEDLHSRQTFLLKWAEKKAELYLLKNDGERQKYIGGHYIDAIPDGPLHIELSAYAAPPEEVEAFSSELTIEPDYKSAGEVNRSLVLESISLQKR